MKRWVRGGLSGLVLGALAYGCGDEGAGSSRYDAGSDGSVVSASPIPSSTPRAPNGAALPDAGPIEPGGPRDAAGAPADAAPPASADAETPRPGALTVALVDGKTVSIYLPKGASPKDKLPVVFSLHGLSIPAIVMADVTGLPAVADENGFVAVFPDGTGGTWNTGGAICGLGSFVAGGADDAAYLENILVEIEKTQALDRDRVFLSGFSMGGYGTNHLACSRPKMFRAAAPASGGYPTELCAPDVIPVMIFHGTSDGTISYDCGKGARDLWVAHNHCGSGVDVMPIMGGTCEWQRGCPEHGQVVLCTFEGMGHGWAGSVDPFAFGGPQYESATALMWKFFAEQL